MKMYLIYAQIGDQQDWCWEEVDRTTDENRATEAASQGCHVYEDEDTADENTTIDNCRGFSTINVED